MRRLALTAALLAALAPVAPAFADNDYQGRLNVPRAEWQSPTQIADKLRSQGYTVREIEADDGAYEVELTDKGGTRIEAHAHPATGELIYGYDD
jgi:hypothetical protein